MKAAIIVNSASGTVQGLETEDLCSQIAAKMGALGWTFTLSAVSGEELGDCLQTVGEDTDLLIAGGGDGTIAAAAERAIGLDIPLAILPLGTMNIFARDLNIPLNLEAALDALESDRIRKVDVAYVNEAIFLNSVILGAFANLARHRERIRSAEGFEALVANARQMFRTFRGYSRHSYEVKDDNRRRTVRAGTIQVTNNPLVNSLVPLPQRKSISSGLLGCYIDHSRTPAGFAKASMQAVSGGMPADPSITSFENSEITIGPRRDFIEASVDGEVRKLESPLQFRVLHDALKIRGGG